MRPMILPLCLVGTLVATGALAEQCNRNDQSQIGLNICADADFKAADAKLNKTYGTVVKRLAGDADTRKLLQVSQRAWIAFRDAECHFRTDLNKDGTIYPMLVAGCRQELTEARTKQLDAYLHCQEGDLSCPVPAP